MIESFEKTRLAGSIAAGALDEVNNFIKPGISTLEIDKLCYQYINDHKAYVDLIHIDDVISGIISLLDKNNYNDYKRFSYDLSSSKQITIIQLIKLIEGISNYKFSKIISKKTFDQYLDIPYIDKRLINWTNRISLKKGLKKNYDLFFP